MTFESILIVAALAAGVGLVSEAFESHALRDSGLLLKVVGMLALIAGFFGFGLRASTGLRIGRLVSNRMEQLYLPAKNERLAGGYCLSTAAAKKPFVP
jgi:hypothetical protein